MQALINDLFEYARTNNNAQRCTMTDMNTVLEHTRKNSYEAINESNANIISDTLATLSINPPYTIRLLQISDD
ncbi:MAG: hypothetical protein GXP21_06745 [Gammaproteobacteria bacterium]|nr:hypothetical protein [Gammaproteobacteria bacterium]